MSKPILITAIEQLINDEEYYRNKKLTDVDFKFLVDVNAEFVTRNISKFIRGAVEHGDDFQTAVCHTDELLNELLDAVNLLKAIRDRRNQYDERYKAQ